MNVLDTFHGNIARTFMCPVFWRLGQYSINVPPNIHRTWFPCSQNRHINVLDMFHGNVARSFMCPVFCGLGEYSITIKFLFKMFSRVLWNHDLLVHGTPIFLLSHHVCRVLVNQTILIIYLIYLYQQFKGFLYSCLMLVGQVNLF